MLRRVVAISGAIVALGGALGVVALASSGGGPKVAATSPPAGPVGAPAVNRTPQSTAEYWTPERIAAARPMERTADGVSTQSYGSSVLDFARSRIAPQSANKQPPYKGVGKLYFTEPGVGDFQCSASIIAKRLIVTAGHCIYGNGGYFTNWQFIPGFDGSLATLALQRPYGTWDWAAAIVPSNYQSSSSTVINNYDFGIIQMADQAFNGGKPITVQKKVGFNFSTVVGHLFDTEVGMLGYPCNLDACNIMQRVDTSDHRPSGVTSGNGSTAYEYGSDMSGGSSGGPWVENLGNPASAGPTGGFSLRNAVVAVTSYGYNDSTIEVQGASQLNSDFTSIRTTMCNFAVGNC